MMDEAELKFSQAPLEEGFPSGIAYRLLLLFVISCQQFLNAPD
jgi:hypothetical protein